MIETPSIISFLNNMYFNGGFDKENHKNDSDYELEAIKTRSPMDKPRILLFVRLVNEPTSSEIPALLGSM